MGAPALICAGTFVERYSEGSDRACCAYRPAVAREQSGAASGRKRLKAGRGVQDRNPRCAHGRSSRWRTDADLRCWD